MNAPSFEFMCFVSEKEKYIAAYSSGKDPKISLWEWEKGKLKTFCDVSGYEKINGIFLINKTEDYLFCYGKPIKKNITFRTF